eukprot:1196219-Prorocentrum_minimum.AAC.5
MAAMAVAVRHREGASPHLLHVYGGLVVARLGGHVDVGKQQRHQLLVDLAVPGHLRDLRRPNEPTSASTSAPTSASTSASASVHAFVQPLQTWNTDKTSTYKETILKQLRTQLKAVSKRAFEKAVSALKSVFLVYEIRNMSVTNNFGVRIPKTQIIAGMNKLITYPEKIEPYY